MTFSKDELKAVLEEVYEERSHIDSMAHGEHHAWIQERIAAEEARKEEYRARTELYRELAKSAIGWSIPVILTGIVYYLHNGHWPAGL